VGGDDDHTAAGRQHAAAFDAPLAKLDSRSRPLAHSAHEADFLSRVFIRSPTSPRRLVLLHVARKCRSRARPVYRSARRVLAIAQAGAAASCTEALSRFDKLNCATIPRAGAWKALGHETTISY